MTHRFSRFPMATAMAPFTVPALASDLAPPSVPSSFFLFSDAQVGDRRVMDSRAPAGPATKDNPLNGRSIPKTVLTIGHANAWAYGTDVVSLDIPRSGSQHPSGYALPNLDIQTGIGATEACGLHRATLSGNALTGPEAFALLGFVEDVSLSYGTDLNSKNTSFGSEKHLVVAGLNVAFDVPAGLRDLAVHASREFNRNGTVPLPARDTEFDATPELGIVYGQPDKVDVFVGFQYWRNKFGNDAARVPDSEETTAPAGVSFHVF
ncbi:hypothetical protein [Methylobacterium sp. Leaf399]|uniref:hypothetical protein n=1 Tax=Methylobacterium sp. Leaf399 TaxID=1736364 RepID=UPI000A7B6F01|nr:hypothetical protein [Methylobacterium sp. Leaf399]